jgi:enoyl-CoA hydratase/carnithine racemase
MGSVHTSNVDDGVVVLEMDNPPLNAMNLAMLTTLEETFLDLGRDLAIRAIVLTGRGRAFCSGADLKEVASEASGEILARLGRVLELVAGSRAPVIAAINGHAIGGGFELALCCDLRIASSRAQFICAGVNVGLMASAYRLPRLIGASRAKAMLLTGLPQSAATAEAWGLVMALHEPDELNAAALTLARRIATRAPLSVEANKRVADRAHDISPDDGAKMIAAELQMLRQSADHRAAVRAFAARRVPVFSRR